MRRTLGVNKMEIRCGLAGLKSSEVLWIGIGNEALQDAESDFSSRGRFESDAIAAEI